ncbi:MAG: heavy metal translocating P-type ATPase [Paracoccaceae bacterium]
MSPTATDTSARSAPSPVPAPAPSSIGCCAAGAAARLAAERLAVPDAKASARAASGGAASVDLLVPGIRCAACMAAIETGLGKLGGVASARVNLTNRRVHALYDPGVTSEEAITARLAALGYEAKPYDAAAMAEIERDAPGRDLLARLGVAGFAAMNVMLLSVAVWSGAEAATRDLLHWISALIALPAIAFAGQPFFRSAFAALSARRLNMDVPISLAVLLAAGTSVYETAQGAEHAYFDASVSLLFFLLIGRYLDHRTRARARSAAAELSALAVRSATVIEADGRRRTIPAEDLAPGLLLAVAAGERIPADGRVERGESDLDRSLVTGESVPEPVSAGAAVHAGMLNLSGPLEIRATATGDGTLLAEIARLIEAAEHGRTKYDRWADQAARIYAPGVHLIAAIAFLGWLSATGDWRLSLTIATALLIITCPCALALAVPAVHAVAGGRLFRHGIFLKDAGALERLAKVDLVAFDKTGTLTDGRARVTGGPAADDPAWPVAAALAASSRHPLARAVAEAAEARGIAPAPVIAIREHPGRGVEGHLDGRRVRLGAAAWVGAPESGDTAVWLDPGTGTPVAYPMAEWLREGVPGLCESLFGLGLDVVLLSGDGPNPVARVAEATGIRRFNARMTPQDKLRCLSEAKEAGLTVLMVGDGLNDAPSLAAADVSMSPVSAADVSRTAADMVFVGERLDPVAFAICTARTARHRALQNFALAAVYNAIAIPLALAGLVTPLVAALAMSGSSILVTLNALRRWRCP